MPASAAGGPGEQALRSCCTHFASPSRRADSLGGHMPIAREVRFRSILFVFFLLLGASRAFAQFDSASLVGTVRDASGALVPGAKVTLTSVETAISVSKTTGD